MIVCNLVREGPRCRDVCEAGAHALGFKTVGHQISNPDLVITWNRHGRFDQYCRVQESRGVPVIVAENGYFGKSFQGGPWYAWALGAHAGAGRWLQTNLEGRWAALGAKPLPLQRPRYGARSTALVLGQRGIGPRGIASPAGWEQSAVQRLRSWGVAAVVRPHPGKFDRGDLYDVLQKIDFVVTWNSGAAIKSMLAGKSVLYDFPHWIGRRGALPFTKESIESLCTADDNRVLGFMDAAAAQRSAKEIESGHAIKELLELT